MTKKHFIALANHLKWERDNGIQFDHSHVESLADFCEGQNPRFNRQRWLDYIAGTCGKNGGKVKQTVNA